MPLVQSFAPRRKRWIVLAACAAVWLAHGVRDREHEAFCAEPSSGREEITIREGLVIGPVGQFHPAPLHYDPIEKRIVDGLWAAPKRGETVTLGGGETRTWEAIEANEDGWFEKRDGLRGGYLYATVESEDERPMILDARGHSCVYVNGELRAGNVYQYDYSHLPVLLRKGTNEFVFATGRGRLQAKLAAPGKPIFFDKSDPTLPDLIVGEETDTWGALLVINATDKAVSGLAAESMLSQEKGEGEGSSGESRRVEIPTLPPLSLRKTGFPIRGSAPKQDEKWKVDLRLVRRGNDHVETLDETSANLDVRGPRDKHKRTFVSEIDDSVQYYAVTPASPLDGKDSQAPALFLSTHGAAVEATNQAYSYAPKTWGHIVAPSNRRPYGYDWEEWGRMDALEVLDVASKRFQTDPRRTYVSGHSMGGHGAWHLGATYPGLFAAIGPCSGWRTFWGYDQSREVYQKAMEEQLAKETDEERKKELRERMERMMRGMSDEKIQTPMEKMLRRARATSDITTSITLNLSGVGVYILHGEKDDNVPVIEAREMARLLKTFHHNFYYHEEPGAGHWWENSDEPGAECQDWPGIYDMFARSILPTNDSTRCVEFYTANPGVSAWRQWACIEAQIHHLQPSAVKIQYDPWTRRFIGTTHNVARLALDLGHVMATDSLTIQLDGQKLDNVPFPSEKRIWLSRGGEQRTDAASAWSVIPKPSPNLKGPHRYGPFKESLRHRFMLVYGTKGMEEENAWARARARYDAEQFWYRGNGALDVVADVDFDPNAEPDRDVILYGNANTNGAWQALLGKGPVQVLRNQVRVGEKRLTGGDLACLSIWPRPGSDRACVAVVAGSGLAGMRLTNRMPYFTPGVAYPDCIVLDPTSLTEEAKGVRAAGFFGLDWSVESGEFVWRE